jgi:predicted acyl esterase
MHIALIVVAILVATAWIWEKRDEAKDWRETDNLPPEQAHRRRLFLRYLPQTEDEARLIDEAIARGEM